MHGMNTLVSEQQVSIQEVRVSEDALTIDLTDGRSVSVPLGWFPRLMHGRPEERSKWTLLGQGQGIHWPDLDENISLEGILAGRPSGESQDSFRRWLEKRSASSS
jgi:hypothetical protein